LVYFSRLEKAIPTVEEEFGNLFKAFGKKAVTVPAPEKYHPELDTTDFLDEFSHGLYHSYIGILRWAVELGRIDIAHAVSVMSHFSAMPREGHLYAVLRIFAYLKRYFDLRLWLTLTRLTGPHGILKRVIGKSSTWEQKK
jgi:hypothetical protein